MAQMKNQPPQLEIAAGATHLFEEPGKLAVVAQLADKMMHEMKRTPVGNIS